MWKLDWWCFYIPAAPGALEALRHSRGPAGNRHPVPYDLADRGPLAYHSRGMAARAPRMCFFPNALRVGFIVFSFKVYEDKI